MILAVTLVKKHKLNGADTVWYKKRWEQEMVWENDIDTKRRDNIDNLLLRWNKEYRDTLLLLYP